MVESKEPVLQFLLERGCSLLLQLGCTHNEMDDEMYVRAWSVVFRLHSFCNDWARITREQLSNIGFKRDGLELSLYNNVNQLQEKLTKAIHDRVNSMELPPRIVRISSLLELSPEEQQGLIFIVLTTSGIHGSKGYHTQRPVANLLAFANLPRKSVNLDLNKQS